MIPVEQQRAVDLFCQGIERKNLPIFPNDSRNFAKAVAEYNPPPHFLSHLLSNMFYVDQNTFYTNIKNMASAASNVVGRDPYYSLIHFPVCSTKWINQLLRLSGLPPAREVVDVNADRFCGEGGNDNFRRVIVPGSQVVVTDDFSLSGAQLADDILDSIPISEYKADVFLMYVTPTAIRNAQLRKRNNLKLHVIGEERVTLKRALPKKSRQFLDRLIKDINPREDLWSDSILLWTFYKVPDNVQNLFTGENFPTLIRRDRFQEPYRKNLKAQ